MNAIVNKPSSKFACESCILSIAQRAKYIASVAIKISDNGVKNTNAVIKIKNIVIFFGVRVQKYRIKKNSGIDKVNEDKWLNVNAKKKGVIPASVAAIMLEFSSFVNIRASRYVGNTRRLANIAGIILVASEIGIKSVKTAIIMSKSGL